VDAFEQYVRGGVARMGLDLDPMELEIMRYVDGLYGPELMELAVADLKGVWPELDLDLTQAPRS
jgi:hypothetical protein